MIVQRKVLDRRFYSCYKVDNRLFDCVLIGPSPLVVRRSLLTLIKGAVIVNKSELISSIAEKANISKSDAAKALSGFTASVEEALKKGDTVTLIGFGTFYVGERAAREGINPKTRQAIHIEASKTPKFRAGKSLKEAI